ncbi:DUF1059 domain-containing protein [Nocardioides sp. BP30]|uniref:DUF1059 domain-containing protein n=1 Tax=Nocardioides sp. BP30 TaxID=3036374 RepID=UPI0024699339|nr:DUF1059 domain-containing protein [Nocardioides sp. BP30]WGL51635.1 DUF1059 domain-containing protein [Nocardioides sp. BP30]
MKQFACGDVVPGCDATFAGASDDDILAAVALHASRDHHLTSVPTEMVDQVRAAIREVA